MASLSDHAPINLSWHLEGEYPKYRLWRLNHKLLTYDANIKELQEAILTFLENNDDGHTLIHLLWDTLKVVIWGRLLAIAARLNRDRKEKRDRLEGQVKVLKMTHRYTGAMRVRHQLTNVCKQLKALDLDRAEYSLLRTKQRFYEGERRQGGCWRANCAPKHSNTI